MCLCEQKGEKGDQGRIGIAGIPGLPGTPVCTRLTINVCVSHTVFFNFYVSDIDTSHIIKKESLFLK